VLQYFDRGMTGVFIKLIWPPAPQISRPTFPESVEVWGWQPIEAST